MLPSGCSTSFLYIIFTLGNLIKHKKNNEFFTVLCLWKTGLNVKKLQYRQIIFFNRSN